ncbi:MAG: ribosome small subunit-dependent GTPase A [Muribaculaceae bacterium]|nr:ribosome small subunit-dependent GTPase A [Muribaculaceae bacterium]
MQGRVVRNTGSAYVVKSEDGVEYPCKIKGNFRIKGIRTTNPVAVGDLVQIVKATDDAYYIKSIIPRKNYIIRRASNLSKESHILAANIDQAILVASIFNPETPTTFIDRFLSTSEAYSIPAILVLNKADLWTKEIYDYANDLKKIYENIGYSVLFTSAIDNTGIQQLNSITKDKISLLAGNSGVGKSSLINALVPGIKLRTGDVSDSHHTGTHTTTFSEMIPLPQGGDIIDIPGVKGFGMIEYQPSEVGHYFPEIFKKSKECKYGDCRHLGEPGCAIEEAVENGEISPSRFASYLSIMEEVCGDKGADKYRKPF